MKVLRLFFSSCSLLGKGGTVAHGLEGEGHFRVDLTQDHVLVKGVATPYKGVATPLQGNRDPLTTPNRSNFHLNVSGVGK